MKFLIIAHKIIDFHVNKILLNQARSINQAKNR